MKGTFGGARLLGMCMAIALVASQCVYGNIFHSGGNHAKFVDLNGDEDISALAQSLCEMTKSSTQQSRLATQLGRVSSQMSPASNQLSRISTIHKLNEHISGLTPDHTLAPCKSLLGKPLEELSEVLNVGNDNVCGDTKISAIENFHRKYVSTRSADIAAGKANKQAKLPKMLSNFFVYYAEQISATCKNSLLDHFDNEVRTLVGAQDYQFSFGTDFMSRVAKSLGKLFGSISHYDDIMAPWAMFGHHSASPTDQATIAEEPSDIEQADETTDEQVRAIVAVRDTKQVRSIQLQCSRRFKPIYSKIITPIVRLADLGYSYTDAKIQAQEKQLQNNELVVQWYRIAQLCELLLPVKFYRNPSLAEKDSTLLTNEQAQQYRDQDDEPVEGADTIKAIEYEPQGNVLNESDILEITQSKDADAVLSGVKTNVSARNRNRKLAVKGLLRSASKFALGKLKYTKRNSCASGQGCEHNEVVVSEDMKDIAARESDEADIGDLGEEANKPEDSSNDSTELKLVSRKRRGLDLSQKPVLKHFFNEDGPKGWVIVVIIIVLVVLVFCIG